MNEDSDSESLAVLALWNGETVSLLSQGYLFIPPQIIIFLKTRFVTDFATSWLAVEKGDVLKPATGDWVTGAAFSQFESSWERPVYNAATFKKV